MMLRRTTRNEFVQHITNSKADAFAKTFIAKADMMDIWDRCIGAWETDSLMGAIITTISKREPYVANLQLLHTFDIHRKKGVGKALCEDSLCSMIGEGAVYFRVSAEPGAVEFYKRLGIKFLGKQKSGCQLSIFKINGYEYSTGVYDLSDDKIRSAVYRNGKGGCVEVF